ncbi:MAG: S41 family peptidase [Bacteroidales bacterium]
MKRNFFFTAFLIMILFSTRAGGQMLSENTFKFGRLLGLIDAFYVDSANLDNLTEKAIVEVLKSLDPHSTFISAKDVKEMNEPLAGNFEGIGIQFNVLHDTIIVIEPTKNGPSERVGLKAGDRIIAVNDEKVTNIKISTAGVKSRLMGPKGTKVNITVLRPGDKDLYSFTITRDKIPIYSLDAAYMLNSETGYIKLNKFAATTEREFYEGLALFKDSKIKNMVIDLRGNPGGYMLAAVAIANQFLDGQKLVVYMQEGRPQGEEFKSNGNGLLKNTRLVVLNEVRHLSAKYSRGQYRIGTAVSSLAGELLARPGQNGYQLNDGSLRLDSLLPVIILQRVVLSGNYVQGQVRQVHRKLP